MKEDKEITKIEFYKLLESYAEANLTFVKSITTIIEMSVKVAEIAFTENNQNKIDLHKDFPGELRK